MLPPSTRPASWDYAAPAGARSHISDLDGPVHWIEFGPVFTARKSRSAARRPLSGRQATDRVRARPGRDLRHWNWCPLGPELAAGRRAVALDLRGFGLTPGTRLTATVQANTRLLDRFITEVIGPPVVLVGNSMGGVICVLETVANPAAVGGVVLIDPALPLPLRKPDWPVFTQFLLYAVPGLGEPFVAKLLSGVSPAAGVQQTLQLCFADPSRADPEMIKAEIELITHRQPATSADATAQAQVFLAAVRSLLQVLGRRRRYAAMMAGIDVPVLLIGGAADRLVPVAATRQAAARNPRWDSVIFPGVGHVPQLEVPASTSAAIRDWLDREGV